MLFALTFHSPQDVEEFTIIINLFKNDLNTFLNGFTINWVCDHH